MMTTSVEPAKEILGMEMWPESSEVSSSVRLTWDQPSDFAAKGEGGRRVISKSYRGKRTAAVSCCAFLGLRLTFSDVLGESLHATLGRMGGPDEVHPKIHSELLICRADVADFVERDAREQLRGVVALRSRQGRSERRFGYRSVEFSRAGEKVQEVVEEVSVLRKSRNGQSSGALDVVIAAQRWLLAAGSRI